MRVKGIKIDVKTLRYSAHVQSLVFMMWVWLLSWVKLPRIAVFWDNSTNGGAKKWYQVAEGGECEPSIRPV